MTSSSLSPLHCAAKNGDESKLRILLQQGCDVHQKDDFGLTPLHHACASGHLHAARMLISEFGADRTICGTTGGTPIHEAAEMGKDEVTLALIREFGCDTSIRSRRLDRTLLHSACEGGCTNLVSTLIRDYNADVNVQDSEEDTPLHVAAFYGRKYVSLALINEFSCNINATNIRGENFVHVACFGRQSIIVKSAGKYISTLLTDKKGNTPLHTASAQNNLSCVKALLDLNAPLMIRNASGKTAKNMARGQTKSFLKDYIKTNSNVDYDAIQKLAKKRYSSAQPIARIFVIGNSGSGKSSFVEAMKKEGIFESFRTVSVPAHTAGIVPSIYKRKHYGRVLFYDFAGDSEYYSSHAAILEKLASSSKGDNIFITIVDLREDAVKIRNTLHYWFSFVQHQQFKDKKKLIVLGSHSDLLSKEFIKEKEKELNKFCNKYESAHEISYCILNCCVPRSKQIQDIWSKIDCLTKDSPKHELSPMASILLGLLERDFSNVTACSAKKIVSHIKATMVSLPTNTDKLLPVLEELHEIGFLLLIRDLECSTIQVVLNISRFINEVHELIFSKDKEKLTEFTDNPEIISSFNVGILPQAFLNEILPQHITIECLIQLQYCIKITPQDVGVFSSLIPPRSTDQAFLFFPALCTADKSAVSLLNPPDLSSGIGYSIGWLARCTDASYDYFPPRFLHVLLLRLIFKFARAKYAPHQTAAVSPDHSHLKRRCKMWNSGVHWNMEEGVECLVELVNGNKGVVVVTQSIDDVTEDCACVFNRIIGCVMETKAEFCHSIRPQFFLLDPTKSADYLKEDNLFAMEDVERVLASCEGKVVLSVTGEMQLKRGRIACLCKFTHWNNLFPLDYVSVEDQLKPIVNDLQRLGLNLDLPHSRLQAIEKDFPHNTDRRSELVRLWMSSSPAPDPPCWWQLIQALNQMEDYCVLAKEIEQQHSKYTQALVIGNHCESLQNCYSMSCPLPFSLLGPFPVCLLPPSSLPLFVSSLPGFLPSLSPPSLCPLPHCLLPPSHCLLSVSPPPVSSLPGLCLVPLSVSFLPV